MWQITTLTEFAIESKSIQKFIFDRFCPFGQKNLTNVSFAIKFDTPENALIK